MAAFSAALALPISFSPNGVDGKKESASTDFIWFMAWNSYPVNVIVNGIGRSCSSSSYGIQKRLLLPSVSGRFSHSRLKSQSIFACRLFWPHLTILILNSQVKTNAGMLAMRLQQQWWCDHCQNSDDNAAKSLHGNGLVLCHHNKSYHKSNSVIKVYFIFSNFNKNIVHHFMGIHAIISHHFFSLFAFALVHANVKRKALVWIMI